MARAARGRWIGGGGLALALCGGCAAPTPTGLPTAEPGRTARDALPDGLYHDFLDGKFDAAGHPLSAQFWETERAACAARTGAPEAEGRGLWPGLDAADLICQVSSDTIGLGLFTVNVRALVYQICHDASCDGEQPVLELTLRDGDGAVIETASIRWDQFLEPLTYQNASVAFTHRTTGPVWVEVGWAGAVGARVDYVELFRSHRNLLLSPPSGLLGTGSEQLEIEVQDPPADFHLEVYCDQLDRTAALQEQLTSGAASWTDTEFRTLVSAPLGALLEPCPRPTRLRVSVVSGSWVRAVSRVTILDDRAPCSFAPDTTRVLLTGFEPFPADSTRDNSSEQAVTGFDAAGLAGLSVMALVLPVEFDTAPAMVTDVVTRCQPDIVVGFGQGRSEVDLEATAYNLKDSSTIAGGVPDNRGLVGEGDAIVAGAPSELASGLPLEAIAAELSSRGVAVNLSDDPGRYVCNDVFYRMMADAGAPDGVAGFVHLPRIPNVTETERAMLQTVVETVVRQADELRRTR